MNFEEEAKHVDKHVKAFTVVLILLVIFTGITVGVSYLKVSVAAGITVALIIATIKGTMVGAIFMHLKGEKVLVYYILALTLAFFIGLIFLPVFTQENSVQDHGIVAQMNEELLLQGAKEMPGHDAPVH